MSERDDDLIAELLMSEMDDEKNIEMQLRERSPGVVPVSVVGVKSVSTRLEWEQDGFRYRAYLLAPQYRIEQMTQQT